MGKDIEYKVTYDTTKLPINESVNMLEVFTKKHIIDDVVVNEQIIKYVLNPKPKYLPKKIWHKFIQIVVKKEIHFVPATKPKGDK